jgi:hypothetical protein
MEKQAAIAAQHHRMAQANQPYGPIADVMGFPAAIGHTGGPEEGLRDVAIARLLEPAIKRAQGEGQTIASGGGQRGRVATRRAARHTAPQPERGRCADLEHSVERENDARRLPVRKLNEMQAKQTSAPFNQAFWSVLRKRRLEG